MGKRGDTVKALKEQYDPIVRMRDGNRCFICNLRADDVHEIISKSQFATSELSQCITPKNMVCLCRGHHSMVQGNETASVNLLQSLHEMYGYDYSDYPFSWYVERSNLKI